MLLAMPLKNCIFSAAFLRYYCHISASFLRLKRWLYFYISIIFNVLRVFTVHGFALF